MNISVASESTDIISPFSWLGHGDMFYRPFAEDTDEVWGGTHSVLECGALYKFAGCWQKIVSCGCLWEVCQPILHQPGAMVACPVTPLTAHKSQALCFASRLGTEGTHTHGFFFPSLHGKSILHNPISISPGSTHPPRDILGPP